MDVSLLSLPLPNISAAPGEGGRIPTRARGFFFFFLVFLETAKHLQVLRTINVKAFHVNPE